MTHTKGTSEATTGHDCRLDRLCPLHAAAPSMKGQLQTTIDALEAAIQLFIRKEDSEAFGALKGIIAGNEMALAKAETPDAC